MRATYKTLPPPPREFTLTMAESDWHDLRWFLSLKDQLTPAIQTVVKSDGERLRMGALVSRLDAAVAAVTEEQP